MFDDGTPIFTQIATRLVADILSGAYPEGGQVPSINELAAFYRINSATANRAVAGLVDEGILVKRRGIGMFVAEGAREAIAAQRRMAFVASYVEPLLAEARALGIDLTTLIDLITKEARP